MTLLKHAETVSGMEKAGPCDCCCSHQWRRRAALLVSEFTVDILSTFDILWCFWLFTSVC